MGREFQQGTWDGEAKKSVPKMHITSLIGNSRLEQLRLLSQSEEGFVLVFGVQTDRAKRLASICHGSSESVTFGNDFVNRSRIICVASLSSLSTSNRTTVVRLFC